jgi:hypothetical protein
LLLRLNQKTSHVKLMDNACAGWCSCCQNSETNSSLKKF